MRTSGASFARPPRRIGKGQVGSASLPTSKAASAIVAVVHEASFVADVYNIDSGVETPIHEPMTEPVRLPDLDSAVWVMSRCLSRDPARRRADIGNVWDAAPCAEGRDTHRLNRGTEWMRDVVCPCPPQAEFVP
jgi:hypothetical protein